MTQTVFVHVLSSNGKILGPDESTNNNPQSEELHHTENILTFLTPVPKKDFMGCRHIFVLIYSTIPSLISGFPVKSS